MTRWDALPHEARAIIGNVLDAAGLGRRREIGIRLALGADTVSVRNMVLRYAAGLTIPGVLMGLIGAWAGGRWIESLLFGVEVADPISYVTAVFAFVVVGLLSGWIPAVRASRVDAARTLSAE